MPDERYLRPLPNRYRTVTAAVTRTECDGFMAKIEIELEELQAAVQSAEEHWQRAADAAIRGLWTESGQHQAWASIALRDLVRRAPIASR